MNMIARRHLLAILAGTVIALPSVAMSDERVALEGLWIGDLGAGAARVQLAFQIGADGAGTLRVVERGAASTATVRVTSSSLSRVVIEAGALHARFEGSAKVNGRLEGRWIQGRSALPVVLLRT